MTTDIRSRRRRFRVETTEAQLVLLLFFLFLAMLGLMPVAIQAEQDCRPHLAECPRYL